MMFIHLVALVATLFLIFGLAYAKPTDRVRSSARYLLSVYNSFINGSVNVALTNDCDLRNDLSSRRSLTDVSERIECEGPLAHTQKTTLSSKERSSNEILREGTSKWENIGFPHYSLENVLKDEGEQGLILSDIKAAPGVTISDCTRASKQDETKGSILQSLRSSIQKNSTVPSMGLNTNQIYNLILKETLKENITQQKAMRNEKIDSDETLPSRNTEDNSSLSDQQESRSE